MDNPVTVHEDACDRAMALVQFDKLMAEHAVTPFFQPIVSMATREIVGYEVLARSRLFGLEMPKEMFHVAAELNLEVELSVMLRWEGVLAGQGLPESRHLFLNTHPRELSEPGLLAFAGRFAGGPSGSAVDAGNPRVGRGRRRPDGRNPAGAPRVEYRSGL